MTQLEEILYFDKKAEVEENAWLVQGTVMKIVNDITSQLDGILSSIYKDIIQDGVETATDAQIEQKFMELANCLYFTNEQADRLAISDGVSKIGMKTAYNEAYLNPVLDKAKPTIAELQASAENRTLYDTALNETYSKAYKMVKAKVEYGQVMLNTLSKILSRRMSMMEMSDRIPATPSRILNEGSNQVVTLY